MNGDTYELHFTQFYDDEVILRCKPDDRCEGYWVYASDFLNVEDDTEAADSVDEALETFEDMVVDYINEQISYYEDMQEKFEAEG